MQFYLAEPPRYYFTHLPNTSTIRPFFSAQCLTKMRATGSGLTIATPANHGMAWAGQTSTHRQPLLCPPKANSYRPRQLLLSILTVIGLALPFAYQYFTATHPNASQGNMSSSGLTARTPTLSTSTEVGIDKDNTYQKIASQKVLKLAIVDTAMPSAEKSDGSIDPRFIQSYGRGLAQRFATKLGATLEVVHYSSPAQAQNAVSTGQADMFMTSPTPTPALGLIKAGYSVTDHVATNTNLATVNVACQSTSSQPAITWQMKHSTDKFANRVQAFLCDNKSQHDNLWQFYTQNTLQENFNQAHFDEAMQRILPRLQPIFQQNAQLYHHDWKMLAAVAYQESHLQSNAVSPTGVRGIMMLTNDTAKAMGVSNRTDPYQSIKGGAKYLDVLQSQFADVPESDRLWFTLAAYNMGPVAITNIQDKLRQSGKDANSWAEVYHYMMINKKYIPRYTQCLDYVSNIHGYLTLLNLDNQSKTDHIIADQPINQLT